MTNLKGCWNDFSLLAKRCSNSVEVFISNLCVQFLRWVELQLLTLCEEIFTCLSLFFLCKLLRRQLDIAYGSQGEEGSLDEKKTKKEKTLKTKVDQCFVQTICDSIDLINETLVSELCGQRSKKVNVTVEEEQRVKYRQNLILGASKLPLHPHHHVGYMLKTNTMQKRTFSPTKD